MTIAAISLSGAKVSAAGKTIKELRVENEKARVRPVAVSCLNITVSILARCIAPMEKGRAKIAVSHNGRNKTSIHKRLFYLGIIEYG